MESIRNDSQSKTKYQIDVPPVERYFAQLNLANNL